MSAAPHFRDDRDDLRAALTARLETLAEALLGPPNTTVSSRRQWRWGSRGSLSLELRGRKRGSWFDHEAGAGGAPLDLIMRERRCGFAEAASWAISWLGGAATPRASRPTDAARLAARAAASAADQAEQARAIRTAQAMAQAAVPIGGTLAETYLLIERGIHRPGGGWPGAIRFHAPTRSLLAVATVADGAVQAVQRVHLTLAARKVEGTPDRPVKVTNGRLEGALVRLPARADAHADLADVLLLAEGPENGLSAWSATGSETWLTFGVGQFQHIELPPGRRVILCRDDDREFSPADRAVKKAVAAWRKGGADVSIATPWPERRGDKSDFNDALQAGGVAALLARILPHAPRPAPQPRVRLPIADARRLVDVAVQKFFDAAGAFDADLAKAEGTPPPVHGLKVGVGIGKSHAARNGIVRMLTEMRRRGDKRNVALAVPRHDLGAEQAAAFERLAEFRDAGLRVEVWRGRGAPDPSHPDFANQAVPHAEKRAMCLDLAAVAEARAHALDPQDTVCKRSVKGTQHKCLHFDDCPYQAQRKKRADIWIVPHELLFSPKPEALGDLAALIVDESSWHAGLFGVDGHGDSLPLEALRWADRRPGEANTTDWFELQHHRSRIVAALESMADGPIPRAVLVAEGLTATDAKGAVAIERRRIVRPPDILPGMPRAARQAALKAADGNRAVLRSIAFWEAVDALLADGGPAASGWASLATQESADGTQRVVRLRGRKPVRAGWQVPTLIVDALLDVDLVRPFWPQMQLAADVQAATPHQHVRQVIDLAYSKHRLAPLDPEKAAADPAEARSRTKALRQVRAVICREARKHRAGRVLVVLQKAVRVALTNMGRLPSNVSLAHHNSIAGRDEWGDVAALVVVGRCTASPQDAERVAEALTGAATLEPLPAGKWYPRVPATREMAEGTHIAAEADRHPDPTAEAVRWQIAVGELTQIVGRARGVNRTAANPVDILVMTDVPLQLPIHEAIGAADLKPSVADQMLAEGGIAFDNPGHAATAYPGLWPSKANGDPNREAAKKIMQRDATKPDQMGTFPYRESIIRKCPHLVPELGRVDYQRAGERQSPAVAWFDPLMVRDARAELTALLGPLAWCRVEGEPEQERPAKAPRAAKPSPPPAPQPFQPPAEVPAPVRVPSMPLEPPLAPPAPRLAPRLLLLVPPLPAPSLVPSPACSPPPTGPPG